jgi:four helix bundle protein
LSQKNYPLTFLDPIAKQFRFKVQIRGASGSIMDNIAEGMERGSKREFIHSLTIAKDEVSELKLQRYRGRDNEYFTTIAFDDLYELTDRLTKMLTSFINYLNQSNTNGQKFRERR